MARKRTNLIGNTPSVRETKVAIYIRVSTIHQVDKDSIPMQKKDLIAYCQLILGTDNYEIFEDAGYSGKNTDRPAFQNMMGRIRKGEFTHVLVWKIDRVSRNLLDFAEMYEELRSLRVTFVSKNEQFDTSTAIGEAMLKIMSCPSTVSRVSGIPVLPVYPFFQEVPSHSISRSEESV